jgi:hypothetical protein
MRATIGIASCLLISSCGGPTTPSAPAPAAPLAPVEVELIAPDDDDARVGGAEGEGEGEGKGEGEGEAEVPPVFLPGRLDGARPTRDTLRPLPGTPGGAPST